MCTIQPHALTDMRAELEEELTGNILPFWMNHSLDRTCGGFYGAVSNDLQIDNQVPRSAILCARTLWTFSAAYRKFGLQDYLDVARWAYDTLTRVFWDQVYGGLFWTVDAAGRPVTDRKHHYAQSFGIYGLVEYYRAGKDPKSLALAQELFALLEKHACEPVYGGYIEGSSREWGPLADMRLSHKEVNCRKSMNTMLHILEAYTQLLRVWDDHELKDQHRSLITVFYEHILDVESHHFKLFFDDEWHSLSEHISYGHDIEGSWLLVEAAEVQGETALLARVCRLAVDMAEAVYRQGVDEDGSLFHERGPKGLVDTGKAWWVQAEAMVGFINAYTLTGRGAYAQAARRCWDYIQARMVDHSRGGWIKQCHRDGSPDDRVYKIGPWEDPYHQSRACLEIMART